MRPAQGLKADSRPDASSRTQAKTFPTFAEADAFIKVFEAGESTGLVRDYTAAARVMVAQLIKRCIEEECPKHKGGRR